MSLKALDILQQSLELIIDSVALSTVGEPRNQAGLYLMGLVIVDNKGRLDADNIKAISSLIEMAVKQRIHNICSCSRSTCRCSGGRAFTNSSAS